MAEKARRSQVDLLTEILATIERIEQRLSGEPQKAPASVSGLGDLSAAYRKAARR